MKVVTKINGKKVLSRRLRVAAYCRVSSVDDGMLHSLSAQVSYYTNRIIRNKNYEFAGVYSDFGISGTKDNRKGFNKLIKDARAGLIDLILTKSISRFARNTVSLLEIVRELKSLNVDIYFEEQNLHTISEDGELMLTLLASFAQEEARSVSENMKWRVRKNFKEGKPWSTKVFGYRYKNGKFVIVPEEAEIVRNIFALYLGGSGCQAIATYLNNLGLRTRDGDHFCRSGVRWILTNVTYTGDLLLQKTYRKDYLSKKMVTNKGEKEMYLVEDAHKPIISRPIFLLTQKVLEKRKSEIPHLETKPIEYPFTGKITCSKCGKHYRRRVKKSTSHVFWECATYTQFSKKACSSKAIPEEELYRMAAEAMELKEFNLECFNYQVVSIEAQDENKAVFTMSDGRKIAKTWSPRSRSLSWTPEMKAEARKKSLERSKK